MATERENIATAIARLNEDLKTATKKVGGETTFLRKGESFLSYFAFRGQSRAINNHLTKFYL